jgi:hypothetical protein
MRLVFFIITSVLIILPAIPDMAAGQTDAKCQRKSMKEDTLEITGRLFVGGNEPFTVLALEREDGSALVIHEDTAVYRELHRLQGTVVTVWGVLRPDPLHGELLHVFRFEPNKE